MKGVNVTTGTELAARFERVNQEFITMIETLSATDWSAVCPDEGWSVGVTAHHVAASYASAVELIPAIVARDAPPVTWEIIHQANARHAEGHAGATREETLAMLRNEGERLTTWLASLAPDDLKRAIELPVMGDKPVSLRAIIEAFVIGHVAMHQPSIEAAVR